MEVSTVYIAMGLIGGVGLLAVWYVAQHVRSWPFPVRRLEFDLQRDPAVTKRSEERGPSGEEDGDVEAEAVEREDLSLWDRTKLALYTYQKRPGKLR